MVRTKCIRHPADAPLVIIHQWQSDLFKGDKIKAALLSVFEYWHGVKLSMTSSKDKKSLLQYHSQPRLESYLLGIGKRRAIGDAVKAIEKEGFIEVFKTEGLNQTHRYLFLVEPVQEWVDYWNEVYTEHKEGEFGEYPICVISNPCNSTSAQKCVTITQKRPASTQESSASTQKEIQNKTNSIETTSETTYIEVVKKEDTKGEPLLDSTLNTPTCPGPAAKSKSLRVLLEEMAEIYNTHKVDWWASMRELGTRDVPFTKMVKTYGEDRILDMWRESLEAAKLDNWWGVQLDPKTGEKKKLSVTNFLSNSNWYNIREKHLDSLSTNVETSSLESIRQQILAILSELNMTAALPQQVRDATGCKILSELDQSQCVRYLNMLKRIKEKKQNQEGTAA